MDFTLRRIGPDELDAFRATNGIALGFEPRADDTAVLRDYFEFDRTVAASDGRQIVGTLGAFSFQATVPGGVLPMVGTTFVGVLPTHRRRGLLRAMMRRHFEDVRARGEPLSGLWASEAAIYGRFGYGIAAFQNRQVIARDRAAFRDEAPDGAVRLVDAEEAALLFPPLYERVRPTTPGMLARSATWWRRRRLYDPPHRRGDASALVLAVCEDAAGVQGYVKYRRQGRPFARAPQRLQIEALVAASDRAHAALWRYACSIDLIGEVEAWNRPVDDPLPWLLEDPRALQQHVHDSLWIRVMDVAQALSGRRYAVPGRLVLQVEDESCPWNTGVFALEGGPDGASCAPTRAAPDLVLPADALGAIYLGGCRPTLLARAGRLSGSIDALARADAMLAAPRAPWCPEIF